MADISNVINVALLAGGKQAARDNMNVVCIMTPETGVINSAERYRSYRTASAVEADWGTASAVSEYANTLFATSPNPINFGGTLIVGFYRTAEEVLAPTSATLTGTQISESGLISQLQLVSDGSFVFTTDSEAETVVTGVDFQTCTTIDEILVKINAELNDTKEVMTFENGRFVLTSVETGVASLMTFLSEASTGTFVGGFLGMNEGSGAVVTNGAATETLPVESKLEGISAVKSAVNIKGACFIEKIADNEVAGLATWGKANAVIIYETFSGTTYLTVSTTNPVWSVVLAGASNMRCLYSKLNNRRLSATYMARVHTVNFNAENSAMTINLKELSVPAEDYTQSELDKAKLVGLDLYTTIKATPVVLSSVKNDAVDNVYNITAFVDAVQTDMFNLLKSTSTKLAQTESDVLKLVDQGEKTTRGFRKAGVFAPGNWSSPDSFGDIKVFKRAIAQDGFYWLAGSLEDQSQASRELRESPVLQAAVKNAGAIHSSDIIINFNK